MLNNTNNPNQQPKPPTGADLMNLSLAQITFHFVRGDPKRGCSLAGALCRFAVSPNEDTELALLKEVGLKR